AAARATVGRAESPAASVGPGGALLLPRDPPRVRTPFVRCLASEPEDPLRVGLADLPRRPRGQRAHPSEDPLHVTDVVGVVRAVKHPVLAADPEAEPEGVLRVRDGVVPDATQVVGGAPGDARAGCR